MDLNAANPLDPFVQAVSFVLDPSVEGGMSDDPLDPGGLTNFGISQAAHPNIDVRKLTRETAADVYHAEYWLGCRCDELPPGVAILLFDAAVNQRSKAIRMLQHTLGVKPDGVIGPLTIRAAHIASRGVLTEFAARRMQAYGLNPLFPRYGLGWSRRLMRCYRLALSVHDQYHNHNDRDKGGTDIHV